MFDSMFKLISNSSCRGSLALMILAVLSSSLIAPQVQSDVNVEAYAPLLERQSDTAQRLDEVTSLEPHKPIERELAGGQKHSYQIALSEGQFVSVIVEQHGLDLVIRVSGADGKTIAEVDFEPRNQGREKAEFVAEGDGAYGLNIEATDREASGRYVIHIEELRNATEKDYLSQEARKLAVEAERLFAARKLEESLVVAERSLAVHEKAFGRDHPETAGALHNLGSIYNDFKQDFAKAETLYWQALAIREKALGPNHPSVADSLNALAVIHTSKGDNTAAEPLYERALTIREQAHGANNPKVALYLLNLANLYWNKGDDVKAEALYRRVLEIRERALGPDHIQVGRSLRYLAHVHKDKGDYETAESIQKRALAIFEKAQDSSSVADCLNSLALIYKLRGNDTGAEEMYQRALSVVTAAFGPENTFAALYILNLGLLHQGRRDYDKAEQFIQRALEMWEKKFGHEYRNLPLMLTELASLYIETDNLEKAEPLLERALKIREKVLGEGHREIVTTLNKLAWLYALRGKIAQAVAFESRANDIGARNIDINLANTSERQKLAYIVSLPEQLSHAVSLHIRFASDSPAAARAAVTTILQRKGIVQEKTADMLGAIRSHLSAADHKQFTELMDATSQLARLVLGGPQRLSPAEQQRQVKALEEQREKLEAEISRRSGGFFQRSEAPTLAAVQSAIPSRAALVEIAVYRPFDPKAAITQKPYGEPRYAAYVVRGEGEVRWKDIGEAIGIDQAVSSLRDALRDPKRRDVQQLARAVDEKVMQPIRGLLGDATQLLISLDGELNLIPFEALVDELGRYLIERYSISYLTSGRDLLRLGVARASKSDPIILANPLFGEPELIAAGKAMAPRLQRTSFDRKRQGKTKRQTITTGSDLSDVYFAPLGGTEREGQTIKSLFPEVTLLTGAGATEASLKQAAAPRLLHIATHGFFLTDDLNATDTRGTSAISASVRIENPLLRSGLALAGANQRSGTGDDGILTALEATGLNLWGTKLVTLSACDTGVGEVKNGEGVYGLRRAFVLAGTETLVMSLWPVSDYVTREMMTAYYKGLKQGQGRSAALREVQLSMLMRKGREHPFYWASFIQSGEWANLDGKR